MLIIIVILIGPLRARRRRGGPQGLELQLARGGDGARATACRRPARRRPPGPGPGDAAPLQPRGGAVQERRAPRHLRHGLAAGEGGLLAPMGGGGPRVLPQLRPRHAPVGVAAAPAPLKALSGHGEEGGRHAGGLVLVEVLRRGRRRRWRRRCGVLRRDVARLADHLHVQPRQRVAGGGVPRAAGFSNMIYYTLILYNIT